MENGIHSFNLVIVGGGPAGLAAALQAADSGLTHVALIERRKKWGTPVRCGEFVPRLLAQQIYLDKEIIAANISQMKFFYQAAEIGAMKAPGFIINRDIFENRLAMQAQGKGVTLFQPSRVINVQPCEVTIKYKEQNLTLRSEIIIGADGPHSIVRKSIFPDVPVTMAAGAQHTLAAGTNISEAEVYFNPEYGAGYAWCFPKGHYVNVGIGVHGDLRQNIRELLDDFIDLLYRTRKISSKHPTKKNRRRSASLWHA